MVDSMESQRQQMDIMKQELLSRKVEVRTPVIPQIVIPGDTPSKKRKLVETAEGQTQQHGSYAGVTLAGVTPLGTHQTSLDRQQQSGVDVLKELLHLKPQQPKPQRNICFGNAKSSGVGASGGQDTMLAADVNLVASGVGKGCSPELLKDFLVGKGITPVEVVMLTKKEVLDQVRTLTFRIAEYQKSSMFYLLQVSRI
jgi:hypothetical protein